MQSWSIRRASPLNSVATLEASKSKAFGSINGGWKGARRDCTILDSWLFSYERNETIGGETATHPVRTIFSAIEQKIHELFFRAKLASSLLGKSNVLAIPTIISLESGKNGHS
jgi:hypothetical protein